MSRRLRLRRAACRERLYLPDPGHRTGGPRRRASLPLVAVEVVRRRVRPVSVRHGAQQPVVLPSRLEPVAAVSLDEPGQVAPLERSGPFRPLHLGPRLALDEGLVRDLSCARGVKPSGAGSFLMVILNRLVLLMIRIFRIRIIRIRFFRDRFFPIWILGIWCFEVMIGGGRGQGRCGERLGDVSQATGPGSREDAVSVLTARLVLEDSAPTWRNAQADVAQQEAAR